MTHRIFLRWRLFEVEEADGMILYVVLGFVEVVLCFVNGHPTLACRTLTSKLEEHITLLNLSVMKMAFLDV